MAALTPVVRHRYFDQNGLPLAGGKLFTYLAATTTPKATYADRSGLSANTNPIILDANGECNIFIGSGFYKFVLKDANDVEQWTVDGISARGGEIDLTTQVTGVLPIANGGTGSDVKATAFQNLSPITSRGDLIYGAASGMPSRLAKGILGAKLYQGGDDPYWNFGLTSNQTSNFSIASSDEVVTVSASGGGVTATFPDPTTVPNKLITIVKTDSSANAVTCSGTGMTTNYLYGQYESKTFVAVGSAWIQVDGYLGLPTSAGNLKTATSSVKTPSASSVYYNMTGNSVVLTVGVWELQGITSFANSGSSVNYSSSAIGLYKANGADTGTQPTALDGGNIVANSAYKGSLTFSTFALADNSYVTSPIAIVTVSATTTVYCVPYATSVTPANARLTTHLTAKRISA